MSIRKFIHLVFILLLVGCSSDINENILETLNYDIYISSNNHYQIKIPQGMVFEEECCMWLVTFTSTRTLIEIKREMENLIEEYTCVNIEGIYYNIQYYDDDNNFRIENYLVYKSNDVTKLTIVYGGGNIKSIPGNFEYCDE